jgi:hypothetical protein
MPELASGLGRKKKTLSSINLSELQGFSESIAKNMEKNDTKQDQIRQLFNLPQEETVQYGKFP